MSAVVVNFNGGDRLLRCLAALEGQRPPLHEILVVDNGSTDASPDKVRADFPRVRLIELGRNRGLPAARNEGVRQAEGEFVLSIDHDCYAEPGCARQLLRAATEAGAALVVPRVLLLPGANVVQADGAAAHWVGTLALRHAYEPVVSVPTERAEVGGCIGACMLLDRRALLKLGGFDEFFFFYLEDLELSLRLRAAGLRILCEPDAVIRHDRGDGTVGLSFRGHERYPWRRSYFSLRHRLRIILTYYRARTLLVLAPALLLYELASLVSTLRLGHGEAWSLAWASQFVHAREIRDRRRELARQRQRPDRELLRGGPLPLAPGFLRSREAVAAAGTLARALDLWWRLVRRWID